MKTNNWYVSSDWDFRERRKELAMNSLGLSWKEILRAGLTWKSKEVEVKEVKWKGNYLRQRQRQKKH